MYMYRGTSGQFECDILNESPAWPTEEFTSKTSFTYFTGSKTTIEKKDTRLEVPLLQELPVDACGPVPQLHEHFVGPPVRPESGTPGKSEV